MDRKLGFGMMRLPITNPNDSESIDYDELNRMVDAFIENGFTYFDTALMYHNGLSECAVKKAIVDRHPRESFTITTKMHSGFFNSAEEMDKVFNAQLERTGAGYFDYYLIHDVNRESYPKYTKYKTFEWAMKKKEEGLIRHVGFSFHDSPDVLEKVLIEHPETEFVQLQINYLDWESPAVNSKKCYEIAESFGKKVFVMEPVKGGTLVNVPTPVYEMFAKADPNASCASWAIRYAASLKNVVLVLSGMSNMSQLTDNMSYMKDFKPLSPEEVKMVNEAGDIIRKDIAIPCTGCSYCTFNCPMKIDIPKLFSLYNMDIKERGDVHGGWSTQVEYYNIHCNSAKSPKDCIKCGKCEQMCPQHLPIRDELVKVREHFE